MISQTVEALISAPGDLATDALFEDQESVFWVDWREADETIAGYCEAVIRTGSLSASTEVERLFISYRDRTVEVPLTHSPEDRHLTIVTLNEALSGEYEIRYAWASDGSDTGAFVPLSQAEWIELEGRYGIEAVGRAFLKLGKSPNVFTDSLQSLRPTKPRPKKRPWWKLWS